MHEVLIPPPTLPLTAFVDESGSVRSMDPDTYLLAATICEEPRADTARATMESLRLRGQRKLHWRDESDVRRVQIIKAVVALEVQHLVVIVHGGPTERPERRRRRCLRRLLYELDQRTVDRIVLESRGGADDQRGVDLLQALRTSKEMGPTLRMNHTPGPSEAMLWVADAICGATVQDRVGNPSYVSMIPEGRITVIGLETRH